MYYDVDEDEGDDDDDEDEDEDEDDDKDGDRKENVAQDDVEECYGRCGRGG